MDNFFNKEFFLNLGITLTLTLAMIVSGFNFDITAITTFTWIYFLIIHAVKLYSVLHTIKLQSSYNTDILGK